MPAVLFRSEYHDPLVWEPALRRHIPDLDFRIWPEVGNAEDIDILLTWSPPEGWQTAFPRLQLVHALAAGVDHLLGQSFPDNVLLARVTESNQIAGLCEYVLGGVLHFHREMHIYRRDQSLRRWDPRPPVPASNRTVGVMGLGNFGGACVRKLASFGFRTRGWNRTPRQLDSVEVFSGQGALEAFAEGCEIVICMLPLTDETRGILSRDFFAQLPKGACLINVGRGAHCIEADLVAALAGGQLGGALIDVMDVEPLPEAHPYWTTPGLILTPHIGTRVNTEAATTLVANNIMRLRAGQPIEGIVDRRRGY